MALHHELRAIAEQTGVQVLHDSDSLRHALAGHPESDRWPAQEVELLLETVRWGGLPRLTDAVNRGVDPRSAIGTTGAMIARDRNSPEVAGTQSALAALAFAAGHLPESEVTYWTPQRKRSKAPIFIAVAAVIALALIGGGIWWAVSGDDKGYDDQAYCDAYRDAESVFSTGDILQPGPGSFDDLQERLREMKDLSPPELEDEWETLYSTITEFEDLLAEAGLSLDDIDEMTRGEIPEGVDITKLQELTTELMDLAEDDAAREASQAIQSDADTRC